MYLPAYPNLYIVARGFILSSGSYTDDLQKLIYHNVVYGFITIFFFTESLSLRNRRRSTVTIRYLAQLKKIQTIFAFNMLFSLFHTSCCFILLICVERLSFYTYVLYVLHFLPQHKLFCPFQ